MEENTYDNMEFDFIAFIDSIIEEIGLKNAPQEKLEMLKTSMFRQINRVITNTASLYLDPQTIDTVIEKYGNQDDLLFIFRKLVEHSEAVQIAILNALYEFKEQTVEAYKELVTNNN